MRVAFLIMNHRDPAQLMRLATTLRLELPEAPIVAHNDKFRTHIAPSALDPIGNSYLLTSDEPIWWGDFSLVAAFRRSMAWMIDHIEFMTLSRRAAEFVVTSARERPDYVEYYQRTVVPDESATATLVCNAPELRIEPHNIHHTSYTLDAFTKRTP